MTFFQKNLNTALPKLFELGLKWNEAKVQKFYEHSKSKNMQKKSWLIQKLKPGKERVQKWLAFIYLLMKPDLAHEPNIRLTFTSGVYQQSGGVGSGRVCHQQGYPV